MRMLVILDRPDTALFTLQATGKLAERLNAQDIRILHPQLLDDPAFLIPDEGLPTPEQQRQFARDVSDRADRLRDIARAWIGTSTLGDRACWVEIAGDIRKIVARESRCAELVVLGRPRTDDRAEVGQAFDGALYDAAATVLIAPLHPCDTVGRRPVVAWRPSPALDAAVATARPILDSAAHVTFLIGQDDPASDETPDLARRLAESRLSVSIDRFAAGRGTELGRNIRAHALAAHGDLLIMGAYTHPHFMEWLFGGPTQDILAHATLPILTHH